ncbi:MAG: Hpt domain-containing protein [Chitinispirillaceae bacterium]|nr:Hpt domain-containing protein [Chitinispirillaceae bacterium]
MKLKRKTILFAALASILLFSLLFLSSMVVIRDGFNKVEQGLIQKDINRVSSVLNEMKRTLEIKSSDWAKWDDLYNFVSNPSREFTDANLKDNTIIDLHLNFMLFTNNKDSIIYSSVYTDSAPPAPVSTELSDTLINTYKLTRFLSSSAITSGIITYKDVPVLLVARPVLRSDGSGKPNGTLIFGIFIKNKEKKHLSELANITLDILPITSPRLPEDMKNALLKISDSHPVYLNIINKDKIAGYRVINNIVNHPGLVLKITMERIIAKRAQTTIQFLHHLFLIIGIIYCVFFTIIMEKIVTSRITKVNNDVNKISSSGNHTLRVSCDGKDELALLSRSINSMLESLEKHKKDLSRQNYEMSLIMNTLPIGLMSIDENFLITPVHSRSCETILDQASLAGKDIFTILQLPPQTKQRNDFHDFLSLLKIGALPDWEMQALNPCDEIQIRTGNKTKWLRLEFFRMHHEETGSTRILVEAKDITNEKILTEKVMKSEQQNIQLKAIAEDPELFKEYLYESIQILEQAETAIEKIECCPDKKPINEVFRYIHLLKGSSDSFGMAEMAETAGILEDDLDNLRNLPDSSSVDLSDAKSLLLKLSQIIYQTITEVKSIFGEELLLDQPQIVLKISLEKLHSDYEYFIKELSEKNVTPNISRMIALIQKHYLTLRMEPVRRGFSKTFKAVPSLIKRLDKNCAFVIKGEECLVDCQLSRKLNEPLLHTIRNALDHGIESPWERQKSGKEECARLSCFFKKESGFLIIEVTDDGRGIDVDKVLLKAEERGLVSEGFLKNPTRESILELIFLPAFSTADTVSMISGRGIGLYSVQQVIKNELSGSIKISTQKKCGTTFTFMIPDHSVTM